MSVIYSVLAAYYQPILIFILGLVILFIIGYANWHSGIKDKVISWIAKHVYRNAQGSNTSAHDIFMLITSYGLTLGFGALLVGGIYLSVFFK